MHKYSSYLLYSAEGCIENDNLNMEIEIRKWKPKIWRMKPKRAPKTLLTWWFYYLPQIILKRPTYMVFFVVVDERIIHYTLASHKCFKFPFMNDTDVQIGPSWTDPNYRNRNIATTVIKAVIENYSNSAEHFFWIVGVENQVSRNFIERAGFKECGRLRKKNILGFIPAPVYNVI